MIQQKPSHPERLELAVMPLLGDRRVPLRATAPSLVLTLESGIAELMLGGVATALERSGCLLLPRGVRADARAVGPRPTRIAILTFHERLVQVVSRSYKKLGLDRSRLEGWLARRTLLPRTLWVHEIVHRYVFERDVLGEHDNAATRFLEAEILKEVYFLFRDREDGADRQTNVRRYGAAVERAIAHIEAHLFEPGDVREVARIAGTSESALLRAFGRELGCGPGAYWRERRLEEALILLRSGRHAIAEIATRVGYDSPTSFGFAFRRRYGRAPSSFLPRTPGRRAP